MSQAVDMNAANLDLQQCEVLSLRWISWSDSLRVNEMLSQGMLEAVMGGLIVRFLETWMRHPDTL